MHNNKLSDNRASSHHFERFRMSAGARIQRATRSLLRVPLSAARAVREQVRREEFARIDARLGSSVAYPISATGLMSTESPRDVPRADPDDPLELLWRLEAKRSESARGC